MKKNETMHNITFAFFGTSHLAVYILDALRAAGLTPSLIVSTPDTMQGRGLQRTTPPVAAWALEHGIELLQPETIDEDFLETMRKTAWDVAVVADYGKILPRALLDIPRRGFLNVHPSLLPRLRGASPIRSAILYDEKAVGVSIMLVDEKMDHGPVVAQKKIEVREWPQKNSELEKMLMEAGGALLAQTLPLWVAGEIDAHEQNHDVATYAEKIRKEDGLLDLTDDAYRNLLKIRAFEGWPGTYTFFERAGKRIRVGILDAHFDASGALEITRVKPEGKKEMSYADFLRSGATPISRL